MCEYFSTAHRREPVKTEQIEKMFDFCLDRIEHMLYSTVRTYVPDTGDTSPGLRAVLWEENSMQTIYYTTNRIARRAGNVLNLTDYRRRLEQDNICKEAEEPLPCPVYEIFPGARRMLSPEQKRERRRVRVGWTADICASLGVVLMTAAFTVRVLMG